LSIVVLPILSQLLLSSASQLSSGGNHALFCSIDLLPTTQPTDLDCAETFARTPSILDPLLNGLALEKTHDHSRRLLPGLEPLDARDGFLPTRYFDEQRAHTRARFSMKLSNNFQAALGTALILLADHACSASDVHRRAHHHHHAEKRHGHGHNHERAGQKPWERGIDEELVGVEKRAAACSFPSDPDLVAVTPHAANGGWAMSPDQVCAPGTWCPVACKPGKVMAQWSPNSTYTYPVSMVSLPRTRWSAAGQLT